MKIISNPYRNATQATTNTPVQKAQTEETEVNETEQTEKPANSANTDVCAVSPKARQDVAQPSETRDTLTFSVGEENFTLQKTYSKTDMMSLKLNAEDVERFQSTFKSRKLQYQQTNWNSEVDPCFSIRDAYFMESTINQLNNGVKNVTERDKVANAYAQSKLDDLIARKKEILASAPEDYRIKEYEEYQRAYDAYHSDNAEQTKSLIAAMSGNEKRAYNIYSAIIGEKPHTVQDEEFLSLHNVTMLRAAKLEFQKIQEERYKQMHGKYPWE